MSIRPGRFSTFAVLRTLFRVTHRSFCGLKLSVRKSYINCQVSLSFKWELSNGKLLDGQGTGRATIDTSGIANNTISKIDVKLEVEGAAPEVEREKTCQLTIDHQCNASALFDEYGAGSSEEQKAHLDRFVAYLRQAGPEATAYIITYAGRSACYYEAEWRIKQIVAYLIKKHGLSQNRIALVDGGFRETWSVDLFVQAHGKCGPLPTPTLLRNDARVSGQCGDKCKDGL